MNPFILFLGFVFIYSFSASLNILFDFAIKADVWQETIYLYAIFCLVAFTFRLIRGYTKNVQFAYICLVITTSLNPLTLIIFWGGIQLWLKLYSIHWVWIILSFLIWNFSLIPTVYPSLAKSFEEKLEPYRKRISIIVLGIGGVGGAALGRVFARNDNLIPIAIFISVLAIYLQYEILRPLWNHKKFIEDGEALQI